MKDFLAQMALGAPDQIDTDFVLKAHEQRLSQRDDPRYERYQNALATLKKCLKPYQTQLTQEFGAKNNLISLGDKNLLPPSVIKEVFDTFKATLPWRKGPFEIFGEPLDAEWASDQKWARIKKHIGPLQGKTVLDIGCNNGYYLYLMAKQNPKFVLGIDPTLPYYFQYQMLQEICPLKQTTFSLIGFEHLTAFEKVFDVIFCMGILYHHTDPIGLLRILFKALKPGGLLVIESMGIPGEAPLILMPKSRYLGMPGHWFLPSQSALEHMISRSGLHYVKTFLATPLTSNEQRATAFSPFDSLKEGLDEKDPSLTKEGYPAPWRFYLTARRTRKGRF